MHKQYQILVILLILVVLNSGCTEEPDDEDKYKNVIKYPDDSHFTLTLSMDTLLYNGTPDEIILKITLKNIANKTVIIRLNN